MITKSLEGPHLDALLRDVWMGTLTNVVRSGSHITVALAAADRATVEAARRFGPDVNTALRGCTMTTLIELSTESLVGCRVAHLYDGCPPRTAMVKDISSAHERQADLMLQVEWDDDDPDGDKTEWVAAKKFIYVAAG